MMEPLVDMIKLARTFYLASQPVPVLKGIDMKVMPGEIIAIMGASGSGKSTLLTIIGCLDRPTAGTYLLEGADTGRMSRRELAVVRNRRIGFIFQQFNLLPLATAQKNVELPLLYAGVPSAERHSLADAMLERVGLADYRGHRPTQLSGGQQQRVAIARALVNRPALLLADEPTGQLDSRTGLEVMAMFQELHRETGVAVVIVTHDAGVASFCQRIVHISDGMITKEQIVPNPRDAVEELSQLNSHPVEGVVADAV